MAKVSVIIPSRNEPYLKPTVEDALRHATGEVEILVALDGWWAPELPDDTRVHYLHWGTAKGLRPSLNALIQMSKGKWLLKVDSHVSLSQGYDEALAKECGEQDVCVPAKRSLDPEAWTLYRDPWYYFWLEWPWQTGEDGQPKFVGLQDRNYDANYNAPREQLRTDDIVSYQGSAWMLRRSWFDRLLPNGMDHDNLYMSQESQEIGLASWVNGGRVRIIKDVVYGHVHKGKSHKRQFKRLKDPWDEAMLWSTRYWLQHPQFEGLIERFGPFPTWPSDWQADAARRLA